LRHDGHSPDHVTRPNFLKTGREISMRDWRMLLRWTPLCFALLGSALAATSSDVWAEDPPVQLFNGKDFSGWTISIDPRTKPYSPDTNPDHVFRVEDGIIHVSGERFGGLTTKDEFENYRVIVEFKWGEKKWPPRNKDTDRRDSGILVHCVGPDKIWTKSIECQIQEHDCGDFWLVDGTSIKVGGKLERGRVVKTKDAEKPHGEWNTVEVICDGDKITNIVNGQVVNEGTEASVTKGRILLQSEGAEIYFRKVELRPLKGRGSG
jgi:3-keto-disaccharide hydrolase